MNTVTSYEKHFITQLKLWMQNLNSLWNYNVTMEYENCNRLLFITLDIQNISSREASTVFFQAYKQKRMRRIHFSTTYMYLHIHVSPWGMNTILWCQFLQTLPMHPRRPHAPTRHCCDCSEPFHSCFVSAKITSTFIETMVKEINKEKLQWMENLKF